jgi:hypothetical protein
LPCDLAGIAREHGDTVAAAVEDDLIHFAPDLLRWHLPRVLMGRTTIRNGQTMALSGFAGTAKAAQYLHVTTPTMVDGPQRLRLCFGRIGHAGGSRGYGQVHYWTTLRHLRDVRHTAALLERCGGGDRPPFFDPDVPRAAPKRCPRPTLAPPTRRPAQNGPPCCMNAVRSRRRSPRPGSSSIRHRFRPAGAGRSIRGVSWRNVPWR